MASQSQLNKLSKMQKQCVYIINKSIPISDITGHFVRLRIMKLDHLITLNLCKLCKISHKNMPKPLLQIFNFNGGKKQHRYPTMNRLIPNIQKHDTLLFNRSFQCKNLTEFGKLPMYLKSEKHLKKFIKNCKQHLSNSFQA